MPGRRPSRSEDISGPPQVRSRADAPGEPFLRFLWQAGGRGTDWGQRQECRACICRDELRAAVFDFDRTLGCIINAGRPASVLIGRFQTDRNLMTTQHPQPAPRTVLITGTSSGIGLATAIAAARAGWTTIATMRDLSRSNALQSAAAEAGVGLDIRTLDVTDESAIGREIAYATDRYGRLDAVVNNAGSATLGTLETLSMDDFRSAMEVNYFGMVALTRAAMPHLRASGGRLVTISSVGGAVGQPFNEAYCAAKFAVEGFLESLQPVAKTVGVGVHIIEPGAVSSEFVANAGIDPAAMIASAGAYTPALSAYISRTSAQFSGRSAQSPDDVAQTVLSSLQDSNPAFRIQTSEWAREFVAVKLSDLDGSRLTSMTAGWVGL